MVKLAPNTDGFFLVHGVWTNPDGITVDHAWVESDKIVFDTVSGKAFTKSTYYKNARAIKKYSYMEAAGLMIKTEHYGPWNKESERLNDKAVRKTTSKH